MIFGLSINAQNLLKPVWKFKTGDDTTWADINHIDTAWKEIKGGTVWEKQGFENYDGFAWYRQTLVIPSKLRQTAKKNNGFILNLARIDDADYTYFNGKLLGKTGDLPPNYQVAYDMDRGYEVPLDEIRWDEKNCIAVRIYDERGNGGIYGDNISLSIKGVGEMLSIEPDIKQADHIFIDQPEISLPIKLHNHSTEEISGKLYMEIFSDFGTEITTRTRKFTLSEHMVGITSFELMQMAPGFYSVELYFESEITHKTEHFNFGVDPEKIVSPTDRPDDFQSYWDKARQELSLVDPHYNLIKQDSMSTPEKDVFLVEMRSLNDVLIRGWYIKPVKKGKYPAILHVQGYSSYMKPDRAYQGNDMVVFALNIRGHGNSRDSINPGFPGYLVHNLHDSEKYIYRGAYMDCLRAVDFLYSRPEIDTSRVVVEGGSQGGALSFATAALDNRRINLCVPHVPFLSDFKDYFRIATWPANEFTQYEKEHPDMSWEDIYHTLSYIDIKKLASWVEAPVLMGVGLEDNVCPPHINFAAYNQLSVPKEYIVYPFAGHSIPPEYHVYKYQWIKKQLGMD